MEPLRLTDLLGTPKRRRGAVLPSVPPRPARYPKSRSSLYAEIAAGQFMPPMKLGPRVAVWIGEEVDAVLRVRAGGVQGSRLKAFNAEIVQARAKADAAVRYEALVKKYLARLQ